jgi:hypothetical protein
VSAGAATAPPSSGSAQASTGSWYVAARLSAESGTSFAGRPRSQLDIVIDVGRARHG